MLQKLEEVRNLLSGDLSHDNRAKAKEIVNSLIAQETQETTLPPALIDNIAKAAKSIAKKSAKTKVPDKVVKEYIQNDEKVMTGLCLTPTGVIEHVQNSWNESINRALEHMAVGRKTLLVEELESPPHTFYSVGKPFYFSDGKSIVRGREKAMGESFPLIGINITGSFDVRSKPILKLNRTVLDECAIKIKRDYERQENEHIFNALRLISEKCNRVTNYYATGCTKFSDTCVFPFLTRVAGELSHSCLTKLVCSPRQISQMSLWEHVDDSTVRERLTSNLYGHILTADMHACEEVPDAELFVTACPNDVGHMFILNPLTTKIEHKDDIMTVSYSATIAIVLYENMTSMLRLISEKINLKK